MADLNKSLLTLTYTPTGGEELEVCRFGKPLISEPEFPWELQTQTCDPIGSQWAEDHALGNSRRRAHVSALVYRKSTSALVRYMRHLEMVANMQREGVLLWQEGFVQGSPTYKIEWTALVMNCAARYATMEEIPSDTEAGAWAVIEWEIQLTKPVEL